MNPYTIEFTVSLFTNLLALLTQLYHIYAFLLHKLETKDKFREILIIQERHRSLNETNHTAVIESINGTLLATTDENDKTFRTLRRSTRIASKQQQCQATTDEKIDPGRFTEETTAAGRPQPSETNN